MALRRDTATSILTLLLVATALPAAAQVPELFVTSDRCLACHNGLVTPEGEDASIGVSWRSSMMANSARDPYWQASVRRETMAHPTAAAAIQDECAACHMPMARYQAHAEGREQEVFATLPIARGDAVAADGVSCAMCHQIGSEKLGEDESFTAGFVVDETTPAGERKAYGPFDVDPGRQRVMRSAARLEPEKASHIQRAEVCATCHTLITHALDDEGNVVGELPEQVPYLEWRHSTYRDVRSCQDCHMPEVEGGMPIASVVGLTHDNVSRHVFRGGNVLMPRILSRHATELGVAALPLELRTTVEQTKENLETRAARIDIEDVVLDGHTLGATVDVVNLAGHKLPSAYPSRRAWLHVTVRDASEGIVFESGALEANGSIAGNDNDADAARFEPHYEEIRSADQVQIYEPILADHRGDVTTVLLSGLTYAKDNRLLPSGFDKATAEDRVAVRGGAQADDDFTGGGDRVRYRVGVGDAEGPFTVEAVLWYQPIGYRWAHNLDDQTAPEIQRFVGYFEEMAPVSAAVLARARAVTE